MTATKMSGRSATKPDADDRLRGQEACRLRVAGMGYAQIAERMNYADESGARKAVDRLLSRTDHEQAAELRQLEGRRLDQLQQAHWVAALQGNTDAARIVLQVIDRRMKLFGLAAPVKIALDQELTDVAWANQLSGLIDSLGVTGLAEAMQALPGSRTYGAEIDGVVDAEVIAEPPGDADTQDPESPASGPPDPADRHPLRPVAFGGPESGKPDFAEAARTPAPAGKRRWSNV